MDTATLRALRFAATLTDVAPSVRLQLRRGEWCVLRVARDETTAPLISDAPTCHPDEFRASVAHAYRNHLHGYPAGHFEAIAAGAEAIDVTLRPGDLLLPGGIYRFQSVERYLYLFMTTLAPRSCQRALGLPPVIVERRDEPTGRTWERVGFHFDELTEVTVVHVLTAQRGATHAPDAMARMLEVLVVAEALADLGVGALDRPGEARA